MNTLNMNNSITFGELIPTEQLLKSAVRIHKFEDAKILNNAIGVNYSGHISFYKRAIEISERIIKNNPMVAEIVSGLKKIANPQAQAEEIKNLKTKYGEYLDVVV